MPDPSDHSSFKANGPGGDDGAGFFTNSGGCDKGVSAFGNTIGVKGWCRTGFAGVVGTSETTTGVFGSSQTGWGIDGHSDNGYGGHFSCGKANNPGGAQLRLEPSSVLRGAPDLGFHGRGEFFVDMDGNLFYCVADGTPGTWKQVQLV